MKKLMILLEESGEKLLKLIALGLNLANSNALTDLTDDGWHHMRVLRFPQVDNTNGKGKAGRGNRFAHGLRSPRYCRPKTMSGVCSFGLR